MPERSQPPGKHEMSEGDINVFFRQVEAKIPERRLVNPADADYQALALAILKEGKQVLDRTGTGTKKLFGTSLRFDLSDNKFPLLTTKKIYTKAVFYELLWFLRGETNVKWLQDHGVKIWNEWANEDGELGPVYGNQWRSWETADGRTVDQISEVIGRIKNNPYDRRHIVSAWNVGELQNMALPPCHLLFQFDVMPNSDGDRDTLNCQMYQRSADLFLGVPFNIASYATLHRMVAQVTDKEPGELIIVFGDTHIYSNHQEQFLTQLSRHPYPPPTLALNPEVRNIDDFTFKDIEVQNYQSHPKISAPISV